MLNFCKSFFQNNLLFTHVLTLNIVVRTDCLFVLQPILDPECCSLQLLPAYIRQQPSRCLCRGLVCHVATAGVHTPTALSLPLSWPCLPCSQPLSQFVLPAGISMREVCV